MAIRTFKEIIDNKGYRIASKDRDLFEEGNLRSFFGLSENDYIEFIVYDVNDNQLPLQITDAGDTAPVKYVKISSETIRNYFMIAEGTRIQRGEFPTEYFIDVERLLRESGYDNGIFKTQITLINRRLGTYDESQRAKMWIKEISPSRTEVRLLPQRNSVADKTDLVRRFQIFKNDGEFRDDNVYYAPAYVTGIDSDLVQQFISDTYSDKWLSKLQNEFNIDITNFSTRVYDKLKESMNYEFKNRISSINDPRYGQPKDGEPTIELSVNTITDIVERRLVEIINKYLPQRITADTESDLQLDESRDQTSEILQRKDSDVVINPSVPNVQVRVENLETIENYEFDTKIDDEAETLPPPDDGDDDIPIRRPNYRKTRRVTYTGDNDFRIEDGINSEERNRRLEVR